MLFTGPDKERSLEKTCDQVDQCWRTDYSCLHSSSYQPHVVQLNSKHINLHDLVNCCSNGSTMQTSWENCWNSVCTY